MRRAPPRHESHSRPRENPLVIGWYGDYEATRLWGRWVQAHDLHRALRLALELDRPEKERSDEARYLEQALRAGPTHEMHHVGIAALACARARLRMIREHLLHGAPIEPPDRRRDPLPGRPRPGHELERRLLAELRVWLRQARLDNPAFRWDVALAEGEEPGPLRHRVRPFDWKGRAPAARARQGRTIYPGRPVPCWWLRARLLEACARCPDLRAALLDPVPLRPAVDRAVTALGGLLEAIEALG